MQIIRARCDFALYLTPSDWLGKIEAVIEEEARKYRAAV